MPGLAGEETLVLAFIKLWGKKTLPFDDVCTYPYYQEQYDLDGRNNKERMYADDDN